MVRLPIVLNYYLFHQLNNETNIKSKWDWCLCGCNVGMPNVITINLWISKRKKLSTPTSASPEGSNGLFSSSNTAPQEHLESSWTCKSKHFHKPLWAHRVGRDWARTKDLVFESWGYVKTMNFIGENTWFSSILFKLNVKISNSK